MADKKPFKSVMDLLRDEAGSVPMPRWGEAASGAEPETDSYEDTSNGRATGDGKNSRHQTYSVQLIKATREAKAVTYSSILSPITYDPSDGIRFTFEGIKGNFEVWIEGNNLDIIYDRLAQGKRESIRENDDTVVCIHVKAV